MILHMHLSLEVNKDSFLVFLIGSTGVTFISMFLNMAIYFNRIIN